ncbi:MmgE/PrpD family protein [Paraburkholderia sp. GAS334]|uniref:MmgE/PrpD family protein n=1 Tax=Paraburkholderia sp. GAS334 TaxID=3035131 RepID=UPI003D23D84F
MPLDLQRLAHAVASISVDGQPVTHQEVARSLLDTMAVATAGRHEVVARKLDSLYGDAPVSLEHRAFVEATAAHALDYDDVQLSSIVHASAVIVPALLVAAERRPHPDMAAAYLAGLRVADLVGQALGPGHYSAGWHATSTIGPVAVAAAVMRMWRAPQMSIERALALALCQAAGTQKSFGSMAKPVHAGITSAAGLRSALRARQGITASQSPFGEKGLEVLYGGRSDSPLPWQDPPTVNVSRKAFPRCYGGHRLIATVLEIRRQLSGKPFASLAVTVRTGTLLPLLTRPPTNGNEARFSADYLLAVAIVDGQVGQRHFDDSCLERTDISGARRWRKPRSRHFQAHPRRRSLISNSTRRFPTVSVSRTTRARRSNMISVVGSV